MEIKNYHPYIRPKIFSDNFIDFWTSDPGQHGVTGMKSIVHCKPSENQMKYSKTSFPTLETDSIMGKTNKTP